MTCTYGELSKLGFGFMRLPTVEVDGEKGIDIELVKEMADLFMDAGFTYFDTARGYHGGKSEAALRERGAHETVRRLRPVELPAREEGSGSHPRPGLFHPRQGRCAR